jgi:hypothetical protein
MEWLEAMTRFDWSLVLHQYYLGIVIPLDTEWKQDTQMFQSNLLKHRWLDLVSFSENL